MASLIIHLAVAKEINKTLKRDESKLLFGSIAPDISKCLSQPKEKSHFLDSDNGDIPNLERFLKKYGNKLDDDFVMGYYIHLYTDYLWFKFFITEIIDDSNTLTKLNGEKLKLNEEMLRLYIYHDYTDLNVKIINKYDLDLNKLYEQDITDIPHIIEEIPYSKLDKLFTELQEVKENINIHKDYVFNIGNIERFIATAQELILSEIQKH